MKLILLTLLIGCNSFAQTPSPCDSKLEKKLEKENAICENKKQRSEKVWPDLESAQKAVIQALTAFNASTLAPYIGCDSTYLTKYDTFCLSHETKLSAKHLDTLVKKVSKNKLALDVVEWTIYGVKKDIYLLCSKKYITRVAENYCKNKEFQPMIEIRKSTAGFYIFGAAIADPGP